MACIKPLNGTQFPEFQTTVFPVLVVELLYGLLCCKEYIIVELQHIFQTWQLLRYGLQLSEFLLGGDSFSLKLHILYITSYMRILNSSTTGSSSSPLFYQIISQRPFLSEVEPELIMEVNGYLELNGEALKKVNHTLSAAMQF